MKTLNVHLTATGDGCSQDPTPAGIWPGPGRYLFLLTCAGALYRKAGRDYGPIPVDHGYAEIKDVDPGVYKILVFTNPFRVAGEVFQSNMIYLHEVEVCCGCGDECVTIAQPGWHVCFQVNLLVVRALELAGQLPADLAQRATAVLDEVLKTGRPTPGDAAVLAVIDAAARAVQPPPRATQG